MPQHHSTPGKSNAKPAKPYPEFPLYAHAAGVWAKKIRGKVHYFGPWSDPDAALASYNKQKDELHAGRKPRADNDAATIKDAVNSFLTQKSARVEDGELSQRTFDDYREACRETITALGKLRLVADLGPADFAALRKRMAQKWGPHRLSKMVQCVRCVFKHAYDADLIDRPVRFGPGFSRPAKRVLRIHRAQRGRRMFEPGQIRRLIEAAKQPLRAMIYLGINCGFGNEDCGRLLLADVDFKSAMIDFARPKTGIDRRCPLWPETVAALGEALETRPRPKRPEDAERFFLTKYGNSWMEKGNDRPVSKAMMKLLATLPSQARKGINFYALRHSFRTIGDETKDQPAVNHIMGHGDQTMAGAYREFISDERLREVTEHVRLWLFPSVAFLAS